MTREEFLIKARMTCNDVLNSERRDCYNNFIDLINKGEFKIKKSTKIQAFIKEFTGISLNYAYKEIHDFKKVLIQIMYNDIIHLEDNTAAVRITDMWNSSERIIKFYMSESGAFYNESKVKITDNTDDFLEYLLNVRCDEHEEISEETYEKLRKLGWYEGRKTDITQLIKDCEENGIYLTDIQKEVMSEFGGIRGYYNINDKSRDIFITDEVDTGCFEIQKDHDNSISIGAWNARIILYVTQDGRIIGKIENRIPCQYGLNILEAFHIMFKN